MRTSMVLAVCPSPTPTPTPSQVTCLAAYVHCTRPMPPDAPAAGRGDRTSRDARVARVVVVDGRGVRGPRTEPHRALAHGVQRQGLWVSLWRRRLSHVLHYSLLQDAVD